jgi:murein DD-endopeptidase MepM/ murein hydrolase activator NlpD
MSPLNKIRTRFGSARDRCWRKNNSRALTGALVLALLLLFSSMACTPAEATCSTEGYEILQNGVRIVAARTSEDAEAILSGIMQRYRLEGARVLEMNFLGRVDVEPARIRLEDMKTVDEGIDYILNRATPLLTVRSRQLYSRVRDVFGRAEYPEGYLTFEAQGKIRAESYSGAREYDIVLTMENARVTGRELSNKKLVLTADVPDGAKGLPFTEDGRVSRTLEFNAPVGLNVTCAYGEGRSATGYHLGVDLYHHAGTPIAAAADGIVSQVSGGGSYGNLIVVDHGCNVQTYYAHCQSVGVVAGQRVQAGEWIGTVGNTGRTTGTHLHFEIRLGGATLDPMDYL